MINLRAILVFLLTVCLSAGALAQNIEQSRGRDQRVNYPSLTRFGPWDDRNYDVSQDDLRWLAPNEEELYPNIPVFFRIEMRKEWPHLQRTGPAQYPRAARQLFRIRYGGLMRNGVVQGREAEGELSRTPITTDGEIKLSDVLGHDEVTVEISPVNTNKVIAGANAPGGQKMFVSSDGGQNWSISDPGEVNGVLDDTCCDPTVAWSSDGNIAYAAALSSAIGVNFYRSTDFGVTWGSANVLTASGSDKEFVHVDISATSAHMDNVYLTWHDGNVMQFARSTDLGLNFTIRAFNGAMGQLVSAPTGIGSDITTDLAGNVYYVYAAFGTVELLKSTDGGASFAAPVTISNTNAVFDYPIPSMETRKAWTYAATDADRSSGPFAGNIYAAWTDTSNSPDNNVNASVNHTQIIVARSSNGGTTWQTSIPHATADVLTVDRFNQWMTVDADGIVHVVYYDTQNSVDRTGVDFYYTNSDDGAVTWETPTRISTVTSVNMTDAQEWGDYNGISVVNGHIITTWTDNRPPTPTSAGDVYTGVMTLLLDASEIWVDFAHVGPESGAQASPFNTLGEAVAAVEASGVIKIKGNTAQSTSTETLSIAKALTVQAVSGSVGVGVLARSSEGAPLYLRQLETLRSSYGFDAYAADSEPSADTNDDPAFSAPVLPFTIDGANDSPADERAMAVRLRAPRSDSRNTPWSSAAPTVPATSTLSSLNETEDQDLWVVFQPEDTEFLDDIIQLTGAVGETVPIGDPGVYDRPMRVWFPLPEGVPSNLVKLFYYDLSASPAAWISAEEARDWLVPQSDVRMTVEGQTYLGYLVRHAGIAQLALAD